jgi:argininosuccinate lyase
VYQALGLKTCVEQRRTVGGPAHEEVERQIAAIEDFLAKRVKA